MNSKSGASYKLRPKERVNIFDRYNLEEEDMDDAIDEDEYRNSVGTAYLRPKRNRRSKRE